MATELDETPACDPASRPQRRIGRGLTVAAAATLLVVLLALLVPVVFAPFFSSISVCRHCGAQLLSTEFLWIERERVEETDLSRCAAGLGLIEAHDHDWLFAHGSGGAVRCAIGPGRHLFRVVRGDAPALFLKELVRWRGPEAGRYYLRLMLDPDAAHAALLLRLQAPFTSREAFEAWFAEEERVVHDILELPVPEPSQGDVSGGTDGRPESDPTWPGAPAVAP